MQTYSHAILGGGLQAWLADRGRRPSSTFFIGSFLPDIPLILLTVWYFWDRGVLDGANVPLFGRDYDGYYFGNAFWISAHNIFHSPPPILLGLYLGRRLGLPWLFWFWAGCGMHSVIDIATHHHDGPLMFWPFDWETRFQSPISYWDPRHFGRETAVVEHALDAAALAYLALRALRR